MAGTTIVDTLDVDEQIEEAKASLDRINAWINSCDSKAGIVLALVGVLLTIILQMTEWQKCIMCCKILCRLQISVRSYILDFLG